jgi:hypothetical protein
MMHRITCAANNLRVRLLTPIVLTLSLCCSGLAANDKTAVKVMTRNMDSGTDLLFIFAATNFPTFVAAMAATYAEINASNIPRRTAEQCGRIERLIRSTATLVG